MAHTFKLSMDIGRTIKDIDEAAKKRIRKAASVVRLALRKKIKEKFKKRTGNLLKGAVYDIRANGEYAVVGMAPPAHHAHLLEFGTHPRVVKNHLGKKGSAKEVGRIAETPFVFPTFEEQKENVETILSGTWL
jgi:HK97 gp10 family phage protein